MAALSCKYEKWLTKYTFENCKLDRGEYGEFLKNYLAGEHDGFVLNLNGAWGTGKTEFLRRLYSLFITEGHPTIYIDAWESDFSEMPLSVVSSELLNQLSAINEDIGTELSKVGEFLGKAVKGAIIGGAGLLSKHLLADASAGSEMAKALFEKSPNDFLDSVKKEHAEQIEAIKSIRTELGNLAEVIQKNYSKRLPVFVLVDELDRCRPSYAIEMLEVIKHFFTTKHFVFVVATDTKQLRESIKSVYGSSFDSTTYLKRFFNREARLDEPKLEKYIGLSKVSNNEYGSRVILYPEISNLGRQSTTKYLEWLSVAFDLSLRDIDQLINKLNACLRTAIHAYDLSQKVQLINVFSLITALIEFDKEHSQFIERKTSNPMISGVFTNTDFTLNGELVSLSEIYKINMICSVMHEETVDSHHGEQYKELYFGVRQLRSSDYSNDFTLRTIIANISNVLSHHHKKTTSKIWLWHDYQRVVRLAGMIE
ncbi:KAP family P-loop NTPase fold protein [Rheinheimera sp. UJ63]|uniref:KAP family P-loop NTPase fold protein n=1 Tax=Rheinheimera sp. UJ63 TaxID=2910157 RepID=UPI001F24D312|nr:P-loop NTPase fold protein [Rheinheimera sp. UJ63]MCF4009137.1 KAP family NTPase [Rheinheimera sp. UJ63]